VEARAIQRTIRQSPRKMRLVIDLIRGRPVPEAYAILRFSKKLAAKQIHKVLKSAVANAEQRAAQGDRKLDVDRLRVHYAAVNAGPTLKRFISAAMGRATPILKRTSHVEIRVAEDGTSGAAAGAGPAAAAPPRDRGKSRAAKRRPAAKAKKPTARGRTKKGKKPARRQGNK
jgi:large subunit ribosomal protein L22